MIQYVNKCHNLPLLFHLLNFSAVKELHQEKFVTYLLLNARKTKLNRNWPKSQYN